MAASIPAVSIEYVHAPVTASVLLDTQVVEVAFLPPSTSPDDATSWIAAAWIGDPGNTRSWQLLIGPGTVAPLAAGRYDVWSRVTDTPEKPVRKHDTLTIT